MSRYYKYFVLLIVLLSATMMYLYHPLYGGHDMFFHFNRILTLMDALKEGKFPIYMDYLMINGYGYITKLFYSDLTIIPFGIIANLTNLEVAYQSLIFVSTIICALTSYHCFDRITKNNYAAYIGSIFYTFSAYRIFDIYIRSAVGEVFAFSFLPLVLLGIYEIIYGNYKKWYLLAIALALLIYSHLISTVLCIILLVPLVLINYKRFITEKKRIYYLILAAFTCFLLVTYYIFPMLEQMLSNTFLYEINENTGLVATYYFKSFLYSFLSTYIIEYPGFYPTIGILLILPLPLVFFIKKEKRRPLFKAIYVLVIIGIIFIISSIDIFPWNIYPFKWLRFMQFSWRLILFSTLFFSLAAGYYISLLVENKKIIAFTIIIILHLITLNINSKYYTYFGETAEYTITGDIFDIDQNLPWNRKIVISGAQYIPANMLSPYDSSLDDRGQVVKFTNDSTKISNFYKNKGHITFDAEVENNDKLELPLTYYIGYKTTLDGQEVEYQQSEFGLIEVPINKSGKMEIEYVGTALQKISWYITLISILLLTIFVVTDRKKDKQIKREKI